MKFRCLRSYLGGYYGTRSLILRHPLDPGKEMSYYGQVTVRVAYSYTYLVNGVIRLRKSILCDDDDVKSSSSSIHRVISRLDEIPLYFIQTCNPFPFKPLCILTRIVYINVQSNGIFNQEFLSYFSRAHARLSFAEIPTLPIG